MLRKITKNTGFNSSEEKLIDLADTAFMGLWSYANIYSDEGYSKNKTGKEVCDLIVVFDKDVIIFSDKNIKFNSTKTLEVAWKRWYKKSVLESSDQLYGAENFIKRYPSRIFLDKECKNSLPFEIHNDFKFHLIGVINNVSRVAQDFYDSIAPGSSPTLFNAFVFDGVECLEFPFCIGDIDRSKTFIHFFDETSLSIVLTELNTTSDFLDYIKERERVVRIGALKVSPGEEEILATYLMNNKKILNEDFLKDENFAILPENEWCYYRSTHWFKYSQAMKKGSEYWDDLIRIFSDSILSSNVGFFKEHDFMTHELAVRELAKESRKSRYFLSRSYVEKFEKSHSRKPSARLVESLDEKGKFYLFLFFPRNISDSDADYRHARVGCIYAYIPYVLNKYDSVDKLCVIATEPNGCPIRSEDLVYINRTFSNKKINQRELNDLLKKHSVTFDVEYTKNNHLDGDIGYLLTIEEVKNEIIMKDLSRRFSRKNINMTKIKVGRNEPCPCGSGNKYKKCHGK
ncbi:SEC-C metal-binding domain-containing protein [Rahnella victoriana]|uniref:Preprotein translocase subunit SecA n=1 Tax=Rahnella woolbedingensis TaxID=1510574 RepID=A0A419N3U7_9GAMM|nr:MULTISPECIES: SEC-C metal-binding domain-containing protein [Rahnella]RJT39125.1 hypothetical protein D6C13_20720 [Rahnella woolbedingensis]TBX32163.1 hypothetical protein EYY67_19300 [Rahnella victoriana]